MVVGSSLNGTSPAEEAMTTIAIIRGTFEVQAARRLVDETRLMALSLAATLMSSSLSPW
jgi:hypothetical protein